MHFKSLIGVLIFLLKAISGFCEEADLWLIEQDFVKFGKKEAYEKYKRETLENLSARFAFTVEEAPQFIYLIPNIINNFEFGARQNAANRRS